MVDAVLEKRDVDAESTSFLLQRLRKVSFKDLSPSLKVLIVINSVLSMWFFLTLLAAIIVEVLGR